ncbi:hypothetical protein A3194_12435 [Candidatus Thiodiazotropha endoloripes]|uniref:hypothetical protein n=1 Tax=Candidatus Thiodiazotropha endoloripes TaxID=1818881 RepID=UPI00083D5347|nr:hypothetical protein [Candidatus Thiodiazotropha endoloripes]ODB85635.1 hypothetical protein A3194_12435 [Candidatus Thiodiazotropha endoloripes]
MNKIKKKLFALDKLSVLKSAELKTTLVQHKEADRKLGKIENNIDKLNLEIEKLENTIYSFSNTGKTLLLNDYIMAVSFLKQKSDIQHNNKRHYDFTKTKCDKIKNSIALQNLTLRGIDDLRERQKLIISTDTDNEEQKQQDDEWLHRDKYLS